jgi:hypothetical protein
VRGFYTLQDVEEHFLGHTGKLLDDSKPYTAWMQPTGGCIDNVVVERLCNEHCCALLSVVQTIRAQVSDTRSLLLASAPIMPAIGELGVRDRVCQRLAFSKQLEGASQWLELEKERLKYAADPHGELSGCALRIMFIACKQARQYSSVVHVFVC